MNILRRYIRSIILEKAADVHDAVSNNYALIEARASIILFDVDSLEKVIISYFKSIAEKQKAAEDNTSESDDVFFDSDTAHVEEFQKIDASLVIVGYIEFGPPRTKGEAYGSQEVYYSAAKKGFGPLMYDLALKRAGKLMSDRVDVSAMAEKVWDVYLKQRNDVEHFPLDDIDDPKTPSKHDDARIKPGHAALNYVYSLKNDLPGYDELRQNGEKSIKKLSIKVDKSPEETKELVYKLAKEFFEKKYH